ncbi:MAG: SDR family oxidoreductase [Legionellaceae bacterium]|nr:SDR family oxidoreductase [Legionellaceae bacterium]
MKILVLGATGMLGSTIFQQLFNHSQHQVWGTIRNSHNLGYFPKNTHQNLIKNIDVLEHDALVYAFTQVKPDVVINCVGVIKQLAHANNPLTTLPINAMLPHRLASLCELTSTRLIHVSTDCVFSGNQGMYVEEDVSDATDLYGKSKYIGELHDCPSAITLRTSIIGHEINSNYSLVDWFLSQNNDISGYDKAIFSGLTTLEFARIIHDFVIPNPELSGLYHVAAQPINKFDLLSVIADVYKKEISIKPDSALVIDRSLNAQRFNQATQYSPPDWTTLITAMHKDYLNTQERNLHV